MELYWYGAVFVFGAVIGSFLNVVIYRLHTGRSVNGRSHCMSCGESLQWYELVPIVSYFFLRGTCRTCDSNIPIRYLLVELLTACSFVFVYTHFDGFTREAVLTLILASVLIVIAVYDVRHMIIPNEGVLAVCLIAVGFLGNEYLLTKDLPTMIRDVLGGVGAGTFFYGLWFFSKGRWVGLGDAKLAFPLGVIVGYTAVFSMIVLSFWIGAIVSLSVVGAIKLCERGKPSLHFLPRSITMKSEIPFAPFLILGFLSVFLFHANILNITAFLTSW